MLTYVFGLLIVAVGVEAQGTIHQALIAGDPQINTADKSCQVRFASPAGMKVWVKKEGAEYSKDPSLEIPGTIKLEQGATYQIKLSEIPNRAKTLYFPTLLIRKGPAKTKTFLSEKAIPISLSGQDFERIEKGEKVTRVLLFPSPHFEDLFTSDPELRNEPSNYSLSSYNLPKGEDVLRTAEKYGTIMAVLTIERQVREK